MDYFARENREAQWDFGSPNAMNAYSSSSLWCCPTTLISGTSRLRKAVTSSSRLRMLSSARGILARHPSSGCAMGLSPSNGFGINLRGPPTPVQLLSPFRVRFNSGLKRILSAHSGSGWLLFRFRPREANEVSDVELDSILRIHYRPQMKPRLEQELRHVRNQPSRTRRPQRHDELSPDGAHRGALIGLGQT